ncbi:MAG: hypothetical protein JJU21_16035 [Salinarimonas sp.]|nr:hypothetical protein [Salinarimonas sp.]
MRKRLIVAALVYLPVNAVLFGLKLVPILTIPALTPHSATLIPLATASTFILALPIAWFLAPYLQSRAFAGMRDRAGVEFNQRPGEETQTVLRPRGAEEIGVDQVIGGREAIKPRDK